MQYKNSGNIRKIEVEDKDGKNPVIDACARLNIWVSQHAFDIASIDFNYEIANFN